MAKIQLEGITYRYPEGAAPVLTDLSLQVREGEFLCIVGRSGCGKSTLLRLLAGLDFPQQGRILLDGKPVTGPGTDRAMVFQHDTLFPWMSARKNVEFGTRQARPSLSRQEVRRIAQESLSQVDMLPDGGKYPFQLSGGMQQRVAIARSLAMDTEILLLDEPFGALDPKIRRELQELLERLRQGPRPKTVVFVTHDLGEAVFLADRIAYLEGGAIRRELPVSLPRPRSGLRGGDAAAGKALRRELLDLFEEGGEAP